MVFCSSDSLNGPGSSVSWIEDLILQTVKQYLFTSSYGNLGFLHFVSNIFCHWQSNLRTERSPQCNLHEKSKGTLIVNIGYRGSITFTESSLILKF